MNGYDWECDKCKCNKDCGWGRGVGFGAIIFGIIGIFIGLIFSICFEKEKYPNCWNDKTIDHFCLTFAHCPDLKYSFKEERLEHTWATLKIRSKSMYDQIIVQNLNWLKVNEDVIFWNEHRQDSAFKEKAVLRK